MPSTHASANPCQACGACCASFRVSFYWADGEARGLPVELTEQLNPWFGCMAGTYRAAPRCIALAGTVGVDVGCQVYEHRPEPCREVQAGDSQCLKARARHGLPALPAGA